MNELSTGILAIIGVAYLVLSLVMQAIVAWGVCYVCGVMRQIDGIAKIDIRKNVSDIVSDLMVRSQTLEESEDDGMIGYIAPDVIP